MDISVECKCDLNKVNNKQYTDKIGKPFIIK